jgi:hypothetical protein
MDLLVAGAGLEISRLDRFVMAGIPRTHGTMYRGVAKVSK